MRILINSVVFHLISLVVFSFIYYALPAGNFTIPNKNKLLLLDCFNLSTTIQAGVGITQVTPVTYLAQTTMSLQQLLLITGNVTMVYYLIHFLKSKK
jgi:hypothetical protein